LLGLASAAGGVLVASSESRILAVASASTVGVDSVLICSPLPVVTVVVVVVVVTVVVTMFPVDGSCLTLVSDGSDDCGLVDGCSDVVRSDPYAESSGIGPGLSWLASPSFASRPPPSMDRHLDFFSLSLLDGAIGIL
jgi:hypothetical protein